MAAELVVDSSVAIRMAGSAAATELLAHHRLVAPPLLWSEVTSAVNEAVWRSELSTERAGEMLDRFESMPVARSRPDALYRTARIIAGQLGWAKTYDAEFLALARIRRCSIVTADARLVRGAARTGLVVTLEEVL